MTFFPNERGTQGYLICPYQPLLSVDTGESMGGGDLQCLVHLYRGNMEGARKVCR